MAAFTTTMLLIGLAAAAGGAATSKIISSKLKNARQAPEKTATGDRAVPRGSAQAPVAPQPVTPTPPPSASQATSTAAGLARSALEKQRKRASAGGSILSGAYTTKTGPAASLQPKTLIGS